jgi:hypothetical protein
VWTLIKAKVCMLESRTVDAMRLRGRCGKTADKKLCTGDPLDDEHRLGAQRATRLAACRKLWRWRDGVEECTTSQQGWGPSAVGEEAGVADANQSLRQHVDQEPSQELIGRNGHHLLLAAVGVVLPAEGDAILLAGNEAMVGDGDAVCVASKVVKDMLGSAERAAWRRRPTRWNRAGTGTGGSARAWPAPEVTVELQLALDNELLESSDELATEDATENTDRQEEAW